ncbi:hypothetical protein BJF78_24155 [Pseudonocardia sp. CNS-139]|nr:hypothetical protein BJF78_24155 [Pseudonocardia sp. CNS-139]
MVAMGWPLLTEAFGGQAVTVVAMGVLCLVSAGQFVVRGALIGMDRLGRHAAIMVLDSGLRVALAALVATLIVDPGSLPSPGRSSPRSGWRTPRSCSRC